MQAKLSSATFFGLDVQEDDALAEIVFERTHNVKHEPFDLPLEQATSLDRIRSPPIAEVLYENDILVIFYDPVPPGNARGALSWE